MNLPVGTKVTFAFNLGRVSLSQPIEHMEGAGIVVDNDDWSVPNAPGYAVRVVSSPNYAAGEIVHISPWNVTRSLDEVTTEDLLATILNYPQSESARKAVVEYGRRCHGRTMTVAEVQKEFGR